MNISREVRSPMGRLNELLNGKPVLNLNDEQSQEVYRLLKQVSKLAQAEFTDRTVPGTAEAAANWGVVSDKLARATKLADSDLGFYQSLVKKSVELIHTKET